MLGTYVNYMFLQIFNMPIVEKDSVEFSKIYGVGDRGEEEEEEEEDGRGRTR